MTLSGSAPGEKLVAIYTCCRYGPDWAQWREINNRIPEEGSEKTLDLGLDANLKITSVTGYSDKNDQDTIMLNVQMSDGTSWERPATFDLRQHQRWGKNCH